jgi:hypothetical protein
VIAAPQIEPAGRYSPGGVCAYRLMENRISR